MRATDPTRYRQTIADLATVVNAGLCVPQPTGELILERQMYTLQKPLNILVEDILKSSSTSRNTKPRPKKSKEAARAAFPSFLLSQGRTNSHS
jgi:hypothetical protein